MDQQVRKQKRQLRRQMRKLLSALTPEERQERSRKLCENLLRLPEWAEARCVGLFSPMQVEPDLHLLWAMDALTGKKAAYSRIEEGNLDFYEVHDPAELLEEQTLLAAATQPVTIAVPEADPSRRVPVSEIDLLLTPGLGFSKEGDRLGKGGGFFDRLLARPDFTALTLGVAFDLQILPEIPSESHDCRVKRVITD